MKDKGAKKKGFKKSYHKVEWGDKKKYHNNWRDKKWKKKFKKWKKKAAYKKGMCIVLAQTVYISIFVSYSLIRQKVQKEEGQKVARQQKERWQVQQEEEVWSQKVHQEEELRWKETQIGQIWQKVKESQKAQESNGKG